jgi:uncharacterized membrane protein YdjX (TVP38/TMEM64 family)
MKLSVSKRSTYLVLGMIGLAVVAYLSIPQISETTRAIIRILTTGESQDVVLSFRDYLLSFGNWAPVVSALLMVSLQVLLAPIPTFFVTFTNGLLFGWIAGAALSWSSSMVGATACFWIARALGRPVAERIIGNSKALDVSDVFFARYGNRAVLITRLLPFFSFRVVSYAAGLTPISFWKFLVATGIGQLPATLLYSYLGGQLSQSVKVLFWALSITLAITVLGWTFGPTIVRRVRNSQSACACTDASEKSEIA